MTMPAAIKCDRPDGAPWKIEEIARVGRMSKAHLYAHARLGTFTTVRVGNSIRVPDWQARELLGLTRPDEDQTAA